jgi:hypothetical protein
MKSGSILTIMRNLNDLNPKSNAFRSFQKVLRQEHWTWHKQPSVVRCTLPDPKPDPRIADISLGRDQTREENFIFYL